MGDREAETHQRPAKTAEVIQFGAPYRDVVHALRSAFNMEARQIVSTSQFWNNMRGGTVTSKDELTQHDRLAQSVFTISTASSALLLYERYLMFALYTAAIPELVGRKELECKMISQYVCDRLDSPPRWYTNDVTREYCGLKRKTDAWWADHLGKSSRQLRRWRNGNEARGSMGIYSILDEVHDRMVARLTDTFWDAGLIRLSGLALDCVRRVW